MPTRREQIVERFGAIARYHDLVADSAVLEREQRELLVARVVFDQ